MPCSTLNLGCEITTNSEQLTGTAKRENVLKLYETKIQTVPYHLLPNVMHNLLKPVRLVNVYSVVNTTNDGFFVSKVFY
jgi:hypothetical protein